MKNSPSADRAVISEIFSSLQGEGPRLGERHLFVRFRDCDVRCAYCDEPRKPGRLMSREEVVVELDALEQKDGPHSFVSLTGGEPLIHLPFLPFLLTDIKRTGYRTYLETAGVHPEALEEVISLCDVIAMDFKPSSVTGSKDYSEEHRRFLSLAKQKEVFVKLTLSESLDHDEYDRLIGIIAAVAPQTPVILQPLSGENGEDRAAEGLTLLSRLQRRALRVLPDVRIVPRLHKILNIP